MTTVINAVPDSDTLKGKEIQILFLGHSEEDIRTFSHVLEPFGRQLCYRRISSADELRETLAVNNFQIAVLSAEAEGYDLLATIKACESVSDHVSAIVVSGMACEETAIALMQAGAKDYVLKDHLHRLRWAVQREISRLHQRRHALGTERRARFTEARLAGLLGIAPDAVIAADGEHRIIVFNRGAEKIFGYAAAEIVGRPLETLIPARLTGNHRQQVAEYAQGQDHARYMGGRSGLVGLRKDGTEFPAEASISILQEETGQVFFAVLRDVTEKKRAAQELEYLASHDSLTALPNRSLFTDRLAHAMELSERAEKLMALLFIDLDGFKQVNDSLGHAMGDEMLRAVAQRLQQAVRRSDTVGRMGGDEFAVILEGLENVDVVHKFAGHINDCLREPLQLANREVAISASIGITIYPFDAKTPAELMIDADRAMYIAKASGKNRYQFFKANLADIEPRNLPIHP